MEINLAHGTRQGRAGISYPVAISSRSTSGSVIGVEERREIRECVWTSGCASMQPIVLCKGMSAIREDWWGPASIGSLETLMPIVAGGLVW